MSGLLQVGLVDVTTGLLLCSGSTAIGVVLYARASVAPSPERAYAQMSPTVKPSGNGSVGSTT